MRPTFISAHFQNCRKLPKTTEFCTQICVHFADTLLKRQVNKHTKMRLLMAGLQKYMGKTGPTIMITMCYTMSFANGEK
ncbi:MAG TPA: hypothetical protein DCS48_06645 [Desulfovibrio sp.]|nr:hypothetical protein [Desulfovibrio sp.]